MCATGVPYFDLSLQHVPGPLWRMRRWGDGERFARRIEAIRARRPDAAFRSSFIVGYPGETEADHDVLLRFVAEADLDWAGFFAYSPEEGTYAAGLDGVVEAALVDERLASCASCRTASPPAGATSRSAPCRGARRRPGVARGHREAPEIDGIVAVPAAWPPARP